MSIIKKQGKTDYSNEFLANILYFASFALGIFSIIVFLNQWINVLLVFMWIIINLVNIGLIFVVSLKRIRIYYR
jgi:magnesium-transporting ATPase (P-type)